MKLIDIDVRPLYACSELAIQAHRHEIGTLQEIARSLGSIDKDAEYEVIIRKKKKAKTLDQNGYAWVLIRELARKLRRSPKEVYREIVRDLPVYEIMPVREDAVEHWRKVWEKRGDGWQTEDMGACRRTPGYRNIKCWYGSSEFTREEMSQFLDVIIDECREQDIVVATPDELAAMGKGN